MGQRKKHSEDEVAIKSSKKKQKFSLVNNPLHYKTTKELIKKGWKGDADMHRYCYCVYLYENNNVSKGIEAKH